MSIAQRERDPLKSTYEKLLKGCLNITPQKRFSINDIVDIYLINNKSNVLIQLINYYIIFKYISIFINIFNI